MVGLYCFDTDMHLYAVICVSVVGLYCLRLT